MTELGLGTVQFGMAYGVSNATGRIPAAGVAAVLDRAREAGVRLLDTAAEYGSSETVIGELLGPADVFRVITKTPRFELDSSPEANAEAAVRGFETSLRRLKQDRVYGLLVHDPKALALDGKEALWKALEDLRSQGLVRKIGFSAYTGDDIDAVLDCFSPDIVQVPVSVLDQRLIQSGHLARLKARGVEVHARSVFLQGLLLMRPADRHVYFRQYDRELAMYDGFLAEHGLSALRGALAFMSSVAEVDVALVGVTSPGELQECVDATRSAPLQLDFSRLACHAPGLLNPSLWTLH